MNQNRKEELKEDFKNCMSRLKEALSEDLSKGSIVIDGTIQRFEFTFELSWKFLKAILEEQGIEATTPRAAIKEAYKAKIISDGDKWIDMLEDRNKTSHIYDETEAKKIYEKIKLIYIKLLETLENY